MGKSTRGRAEIAREERFSPGVTGPDVFERLRWRIQQQREQFRQRPITPLACYEFEKDLLAALAEAGRELLQEEFNRVEPADKQQAAPKVRYHKERYRINKRTPATIATSFGPITLWSFLYLNEEAGEPGLHPLHVSLGIVAGTSLVLAERVSRWAVDHSQGEVRQLLESEHGLKWSNDRLRSLLREYRNRVRPYLKKAA